MIDGKRMLLFAPLVVAWCVLVDVVFDASARHATTTAPTWMAIGFAVSALAVAVVALWYVPARARGKVSGPAHHTYMALFVSVVVAGFATDALKGLAYVALGGDPWWVLVPIHTAGFAMFWAVAARLLERFHRSSSRAPDR